MRDFQEIAAYGTEVAHSCGFSSRLLGCSTPLLGGKFVRANIVRNPSRVITLADNRVVDSIVQIFAKLAEPSLRDKICRGFKLVLDVFEENRVTEASRSSAEARLGFTKTMVLFDQVSDVIPLQQIAPNRTVGIRRGPLGPSAAVNLIDGGRTGVDGTVDDAVRDRGDI